MAVAGFAVQCVAPALAQQPVARELSVEQDGGPSPEMDQHHRRMLWLRNAGKEERSAQANAGLTPEERRQLRRDVHEAGRELYHEHNKHPRRLDQAEPPTPGSLPNYRLNGMPPRNMNRDGRH